MLSVGRPIVDFGIKTNPGQHLDVVTQGPGVALFINGHRPQSSKFSASNYQWFALVISLSNPSIFKI